MKFSCDHKNDPNISCIMNMITLSVRRKKKMLPVMQMQYKTAPQGLKILVRY